MLYEMNNLINKIAQERSIYITNFISARKQVCWCINRLYETDFTNPLCDNWKSLINVKNQFFLRFNIIDHICICVNQKEIPLCYFEK